MPLLNLMAKGLYFQMQNEERYKRYNDLPGTIHGGKPPQGKDLYDLQDKAAAMPFDYRWEYDAENRITNMFDPAGRETIYQRDLGGSITGIEYPNGISAQIAYTQDLQISSLIYTRRGDSGIAAGFE